MVHRTPLGLALLSCPSLVWTLALMGDDAGKKLRLEPGLELVYKGKLALDTQADGGSIRCESPWTLRGIVTARHADGTAEWCLLPSIPPVDATRGSETVGQRAIDAIVTARYDPSPDEARHAIEKPFLSLGNVLEETALGILPLPFGGAPTSATGTSESPSLTLPGGLRFKTPVRWTARAVQDGIEIAARTQHAGAQGELPIPVQLDHYSADYLLDSQAEMVRSLRMAWTRSTDLGGSKNVQKESAELTLESARVLDAAALKQAGEHHARAKALQKSLRAPGADLALAEQSGQAALEKAKGTPWEAPLRGLLALIAERRASALASGAPDAATEEK
ncbi:MAG: hypothetical protein JNJ88_02455 [Planctomycetes bacterium]|nr:hypothetical protein [Planctomycetota bacterium]